MLGTLATSRTPAHRLQHAVARRFPWTSALDVRRRFRPAQLDHPISIRWRTA
jgi:hypothetical protein